MSKISENEIYFAKVRDKAIIPSKKDEDAGYDIYACFEEEYIVIPPLALKLLPTGIAWACSQNFYMQIEERSSTGSKGIKTNAGVIDSGYRGEIKVSIFNATGNNLVFSNLDEKELFEKHPELKLAPTIVHSTKKAIAQGVIHRIENFQTKEISYDELCRFNSDRADKGFGSSDKA